MFAYFTGVRPGSDAGHHCFLPGWAPAWNGSPSSPWPNSTLSWAYPLNEFSIIPEVRQHFGLKAGGLDMGAQIEGVPVLLHKDGWTLLGMWDRSGDSRGGCCAAFAFQAVLTLDEAIAAARQHFPGVIERIERHLGRPLHPTRRTAP